MAIDIFISPSHAASYYRILAVMPVAPAMLVNIDRHHDLSALRDTEELRRLWSSVKDEPSRRAFLLDVRDRSSVPCWGWIEPLMPFPIERVHWIVPLQAGITSVPDLAFLEMKLKAYRRNLGRDPVAASGIEGLADAIPEGPWILSIDLDYFDALDDARDQLRAILDLCRVRPPLFATAAVSMPYLPSEETASRLVRALVDAVADYSDWDIVVDLSLERGPVDRGRESVLALQGRAWREYDPVADGLLRYAYSKAGSRAFQFERLE